jgi:type VI protein secretion system component Hcp
MKLKMVLSVFVIISMVAAGVAWAKNPSTKHSKSKTWQIGVMKLAQNKNTQVPKPPSFPGIKKGSPVGFLQIPGIKGDATQAGVRGWIRVTGYECKTIIPGKRGTAVKPVMHFNFSKYSDIATPFLQRASLSGHVLPYMHFCWISHMGMLRMVAYRVRIKSIVASMPGVNGRLGEKIMLSFDRFSWHVIPSDPQGRQWPEVSFGWNLPRNRPWP